jgi:hypothetical protein
MAVYRRSDTKSKCWFYKFEIDGTVYKSAIPTARTRRQAEEAERRRAMTYTPGGSTRGDAP